MAIATEAVTKGKRRLQMRVTIGLFQFVLVTPMLSSFCSNSGYGGNAGGYGGYQQQQQYGQSAPSPASGGYGQYGSYGAPAAAATATPAAAAAGYTPEQQAAYAQYYGYQYNSGKVFAHYHNFCLAKRIAIKAFTQSLYAFD